MPPDKEGRQGDNPGGHHTNDLAATKQLVAVDITPAATQSTTGTARAYDGGQYDVLAEAIGLRYWESVSVCWAKEPGGPLHWHHLSVCQVSALLAGEYTHQGSPPPPIDMGVWCNVNPLYIPDSEWRSTRGKAKHVTRWAAMVADLDIAPGKCPDEPVAWAIIDSLSDVVGKCPAAVVHSGHGLHPYWRLEGVNIGEPDEPLGHCCRPRAEVHASAKRWAELVARVARDHGAAGVDSGVSGDLARILRVPGTWNNKGVEPVPVRLVQVEGQPR